VTAALARADDPDDSDEPAAPAGRTDSPGPADPAAPASAPRRWLPPVLGALLIYILVRGIGLAMLWWFAYPDGGLERVEANTSPPMDLDFLWMLAGRYDSVWYEQIATQGYDRAIPVGDDGELQPTNLAFFPLFPALMALLAAVTPLSAAAAGAVVAALAGLAAAWALYAIGNHLHSPAAGMMLAGVWAALPHAIVENLAYSESLFTALAAWTLYAVLRQRWVTAGALCLVAGLARPTANALIAAVGIAALVAVFRRRGGWRPWAAMALAPLGYLGYLAWVGDRLGRLDGYFYLQEEAWGMRLDGGGETVEVIGQAFTEPLRLAFYGVTVVVLLAVLLFVVTIVLRHPLPLVIYSAVTMAVVLSTAGGFHGKGRYLIPAFALLLPVATGLARTWVWVRVVVLAALAVVSGWYGAYLTLVWTLSP
jgi:hypothetical protein